MTLGVESPDVFTATTLLTIFAVSCSAFLRGMAGFGFSLAAVPIISLVLPPAEAVAMCIMLQLVIGLRDIWQHHGDIDGQSLKRLTVGSLVGTPVGLIALTALSPDAARILIALAILAGLALIVRRVPAESRTRNGLAVAAGVASGAFSGLAAIPGPPAVAYYLGSGIDPVRTRASLLSFFFIVSVMATPGLALAGAINERTVWLSLVSLPAMVIGTWLGTEAFKRLNHGQYRRLAIMVMAFSALLAGWRGVSGYL
ncbi:sulfite exporter TauE/SafE family protein [Poseidonocella pacifica]|nr:sulfite exporter TauE/SafE family protein [Poseidonocella pacifica]